MASMKQNQSSKIEAVLDSGGGVWDWDMATKKVIFSAELANILGYSLKELPPTADTFESMVLPEDLPYINEHLTAYLLGENAQFETRFRMICKNKTLIWVQAKGTVIEKDESGNPTRFLGSLENITHPSESIQCLTKQSSETTCRARDEALLTTKAKNNFLANMSHEIRTPMNAISGFAEIIVQECDKDSVREYAIGIRNACSNLINIINDILDISKIETGKLEIYNAPYDFASLLNDVITISKMRLGSRTLRFVTNIDCRLPAQMVGDEIRIRQILLNILSNAIKYTKSGYIALNVSGTVEGNRATLRFSVKDSGIGIKEEDLSRLFEKLERINTTKVRNIEGTELGLTFSKQLCEMMGGYIEVNSTYGSGSEFVVCISQECPDYEQLAQVPKSKRILLFEPRYHNRKSIAESLQNLDCICDTCQNSADLLHHLSGLPYDYILTPLIHQKEVQSALAQKHLSIPLAAYADNGEHSSQEGIYTLMSPISCLQLSELLNGQHSEDIHTKIRKEGKPFVAPSSRVPVVDDI